LRLYGTPAEEGGSGKVFMVRAGLMNDVSAMLHWHPSDKNSASQDHSLANVSGKFRFRGTAAHAAAAPERGVSALDGVEAMNFMVNALREHVPQDVRIHYVITKGGEAPNVVPDFAEVYYYVRHPDQKVVVQVMDRVKKAADGASLGTGTRVDFEQIGGTFNTLPNDTLGRVVYENLKLVGGVEYTDEERAWAQKLEATLPPSGPRAPSTTIVDYEVGKIQYGSTDVGDVSYTVPTVGLRTATWVPGTPAHSWQAVAAGGTSIGIKGAVVAAKVLALSTAEVLKSPDTIAAANEELQARRGADFVYRSLLGDKPPALDYRKPAQDPAANASE
jgi:aminobenzoyl-glutamate utilization protein B